MQISDRSESASRKFLPWGVVGFLLAVIAIIYGQTLGFGFLNYDDSIFVVNSPAVRAGPHPQQHSLGIYQRASRRVVSDYDAVAHA